jgi:EmrB/QacA subfamily drug resistance transporter
MIHQDNGRKQNIALLIAMVSSFLTPFMVASLNIALPSIGRTFSMSAVRLGWVSNSYLLAAAMFLLPCGKVADIVGWKKVFMYGVVTYTLASLLAGFSISGIFLISYRALQGVGSAMMSSTLLAILTATFPPEERGKALGMTIAATYLGLAMGPFLGGFMTQHLGWRSIFLTNVPLGLGVTLLVLWQLEGEWTTKGNTSFDLIGFVTYSLSLFFLIVGLSLLPKATGFGTLALGAIGLAWFVWWELQADNPMVDMKLIGGNRTFAFSSLTAFLNYSATFSTTFLLSLYLQNVKAFAPQQAGMVLVVRSVMMVLFSPLTGHWSDRVEPRILATLGMGLLDVGLVMFAFLDAGTSIGFIVAVLVLSGIGYALFSSPNTSAIMGSVDKHHYSMASAMTSTMRLTGQMFSMGTVTLILALHLGGAEIEPDYHPAFLSAMRTSFVIFAFVHLGGVWASLKRGSVLQREL